MSTTLSDAELAAWRAKRTGKPLPANPVAADPDRGPDAPRMARNPLDGLPAPDMNLGQADGNPPAPAPAPAAPGNDELHNQLASALGRVAPLQRQLDEMRVAFEAQQRQITEYQHQLAEHQAAQATAKAKQAAENFDPFEGMSKDEIEMLDPAAAELIRKAARNAYSKAASAVKDPEALINEVLAKRDARTRDVYVRSTAESLGLVKLGADAQFTKWLEGDDSAAILLNQFVHASDLDTAKSLEPKLRQMLKRYERDTNQPNRTPDPTTRLSAHLDRDSNRSSNGGKRVLTPEEARAIRNEATRLTRARQFKEAEKLLSQLTA